MAVNRIKRTAGRMVGVLHRTHPLHCHFRLRPPVNRSQLVLGWILFQFHIQPTMRLNPLALHRFGTEKRNAITRRYP